jgi:hypothetical protein
MTKSQQDVLGVIKQYGPMPDVALVPMAQHVANIHQSSSGVRSRRAELAAAGLVQIVGRQKLPSGRSAAVWAAI